MMSFKMALGNVRKSFNDFTIYFLTLTFSVAFFYSFNAVGELKNHLQNSPEEAEMLGSLGMIIYFLSFFMIIILGLIILFSNNFLIRRRSKEVGIYLTLGMERNQVAGIFAREQLIIGIISLAAGLPAGIFFSQFITLATSKMLDTEITGFKLIFSPSAALMTVIVYGIIFLLTILLNTVSISKIKLIDILSMEKKNEEIKKAGLFNAVLGLISLIFLSAAYYLITASQFNPISPFFILSIILGFTGSFMFFRSFTSLVMEILKRNRRIYYNRLNPFILRQIDSRIRTTSSFLAVTSVILLVAIGSVTTGYSLMDTLNSTVTALTPLDISLTSRDDYEDEMEGLYSDYLKDKMDGTIRYTQYNAKDSSIDIPGINFLRSEENELFTPPSLNPSVNTYAEILPAAEMTGQELPEINGDELILWTENPEFYSEIKDKIVPDKYEMNLGGKIYRIKGIVLMQITNGNSPSGLHTIVRYPDPETLINDSGLHFLSGNLKEEFKKDAKTINREIIKDARYKDNRGLISENSQAEMDRMLRSFSSVSLFITMFIGITFLISAMAIIALRELSDTHDNVTKYSMLRKLGADERMVARSVFIQNMIYFLLPLGLGLIHTFFGVRAAEPVLRLFGRPDLIRSSVLPVTMILIIYFIYMIVSYRGSMKIIREKSGYRY